MILWLYCIAVLQVEDAINCNKLSACQTKYTNYIEEIVKLIQTDLPMKLIIAMEALIILEIHGMSVIV